MSKTYDFLDIREGEIAVTLNTGVNIDGAKVNVLTMREPTVQDTLAMDNIKGSSSDKEIGYFANLCQISPDDIKGMTQRDYGRLQKAYENFID